MSGENHARFERFESRRVVGRGVEVLIRTAQLQEGHVNRADCVGAVEAGDALSDARVERLGGRAIVDKFSRVAVQIELSARPLHDAESGFGRQTLEGTAIIFGIHEPRYGFTVSLCLSAHPLSRPPF